MIKVTDQIILQDTDVHLEYVQASGPGGQNVNKVASKVQLRFNTLSQALPDAVRVRLAELAHQRITADGFLVIEARRFRTQDQNRQDAIHRLVTLILKAAEPPKPRYPTRPSLASKRKRLEYKRQRSDIKQLRRKTYED